MPGSGDPEGAAAGPGDRRQGYWFGFLKRCAHVLRILGFERLASEPTVTKAAAEACVATSKILEREALRWEEWEVVLAEREFLFCLAQALEKQIEAAAKQSSEEVQRTCMRVTGEALRAQGETEDARLSWLRPEKWGEIGRFLRRRPVGFAAPMEFACPDELGASRFARRAAVLQEERETLLVAGYMIGFMLSQEDGALKVAGRRGKKFEELVQSVFGTRQIECVEGDAGERIADRLDLRRVRASFISEEPQ